MRDTIPIPKNVYRSSLQEISMKSVLDQKFQEFICDLKEDKKEDMSNDLKQKYQELVDALNVLPIFSWEIFIEAFIEFLRNHDQLDLIYRHISLTELLQTYLKDYGEESLEGWTSVANVGLWMKEILPTIDRQASSVHLPPTITKSSEEKPSLRVSRSKNSPYFEINSSVFKLKYEPKLCTSTNLKEFVLCLEEWWEKGYLTKQEMLGLMKLYMPIFEPAKLGPSLDHRPLQ